jgi:LDH2 family malate/lactate/ureidoglycolate dehydrogenase
MEIILAKAKQVGTGWVAVKNSNHFGIAGHHAMQALAHDMIGIAMTNASPLVAPTYAIERLLGTNPDCGCHSGQRGASLCSGLCHYHRS